MATAESPMETEVSCQIVGMPKNTGSVPRSGKRRPSPSTKARSERPALPSLRVTPGWPSLSRTGRDNTARLGRPHELQAFWHQKRRTADNNGLPKGRDPAAAHLRAVFINFAFRKQFAQLQGLGRV